MDKVDSPFEVATITGPITLACGARIAKIDHELQSIELIELSRKYSKTLLLLDRYHTKLIESDSESGVTSGGWTLREVLGHMIDTDREIWWPRILAILEQDKPILLNVDQSDLLTRHAWATQPVERLLAQFMQFRWTAAARIKDLTTEEYNRVGEHYELGELSVGNILQILVAHDEHFLEKLRTIALISDSPTAQPAQG